MEGGACSDFVVTHEAKVHRDRLSENIDLDREPFNFIYIAYTYVVRLKIQQEIVRAPCMPVGH
jgi:hypothetical protein